MRMFERHMNSFLAGIVQRRELAKTELKSEYSNAKMSRSLEDQNSRLELLAD
jgi:hypothetical protein